MNPISVVSNIIYFLLLLVIIRVLFSLMDQPFMRVEFWLIIGAAFLVRIVERVCTAWLIYDQLDKERSL